MTLSDWLFYVDRPTERESGWWFGVRGERQWEWGPFADSDQAFDAEFKMFQKWNRAARERGGWAWKSTSVRWVITAPADVAVQGLPFERYACTQHHRPCSDMRPHAPVVDDCLHDAPASSDA